MKILEIKNSQFEEVKIIRYQRFTDNRGYFTENYNLFDLKNFLPESFKVVQINESYSKKDVFRGFHFQYNPPQAKLVRLIQGEAIDFFIDIRPSSKNFGKVGFYPLKASQNENFAELIFIPFGFAHGIYFSKDSILQYFVDNPWNKDGEAAINPFDREIIWNLVDESIKNLFSEKNNKLIISEKDKQGISLQKAKELI